MVNIPKFPCKNHPDKYSSRKCYQCKEYICTECQLAWWHHIFCGLLCATRFTWFNLITKLNRKREYLYVLAGVLVLQIIFYLIINHTMQVRLEKRISGNRYDQGTASADNITITVDTSFVPAPNLLQISGNAPGNMILGLWHNGQFVTSTISDDQRYIFDSQNLYPGSNTFVIWAFSDQGKIFRIDSIYLDYHSAHLDHLSLSVNQFKTEQNYVAITFDAGSSATGSDSIITILNSKKVQCTFFLTGHFIKTYPDMVQQLVNNRHELANHTYNHPHLTTWEQDHVHITSDHIDRSVLHQQLQLTDSLYYGLVHQHLEAFWRAPYGEYNAEILQWAAEIGYRHIGWTPECDSWDWVTDPESELYRSSEQIYQHFMELEGAGKLKGAIILMHFGTDRKSDFVYPALAKLIDLLRIKNYEILTISQFFGKTNPL